MRSSLTILHTEESITLAEARARHIDQFKARHADVDLAADPEATYGSDYRNMCGTYDEGEKHSSLMVLCMAVTLSQERDDGVEGLLLVPSEDKGDNNILRKVGFFERGRNGVSTRNHRQSCPSYDSES